MNMNELKKYIDEKRLRFEGDAGLENLNIIAKVIGYQGHGFRFGSSLEDFLSDNPGCQQAIIDWIEEQDIDDWNENLSDELEPEDEDLEEDLDEIEKDDIDELSDNDVS